jgi:hypothetical protein
MVKTAGATGWISTFPVAVAPLPLVTVTTAVLFPVAAGTMKFT